MTNWRSASALLFLGGFVACATATNGESFDDAGEPMAGASSAGAPLIGGSGAPSAAGALGHGGAPSHGGAPTSGAAGRPAGGGSSSVAGASGASLGGQPGTSSGGALSVAGAAGALLSAGAGGGAPSSGPCASPKDISGGKTDNLGTTGAVCLRTMETFNTIGCSNWGGRTVKVNGVLATCNVKTTFAPAIAGFNYFEISAGDVDFAALVWYTS